MTGPFADEELSDFVMQPSAEFAALGWRPCAAHVGLCQVLNVHALHQFLPAPMQRSRPRRAWSTNANLNSLQFPNACFTAVALSIVFFFLPDPVAVLCECRRVLTPGGRVAVYTTSPELRGTPAAPEPLASRSYFYEDEELAALARQAGLANVVVANDNGGQLLTANA